MQKKAPDFMLFTVILILLSIGLIMVFSSSAYFAGDPEGPFKDPFHFFKRQLAYAVLGLALMYVMMNYDYWRLKRWVGVLLAGSFALLVLVLIPGIGASYLGARRWLNLGPLGFQPSELVKLCMVIYTAYGLSRNSNRVHEFRYGVLPYVTVAGIAAGLILIQPDLGTAVTLMGTIFVMCFAAGARLTHLAALGGLGLAAVGAAIWMEDYRRQRFLAFLHPEQDPTGAGWHIINSLMSLGSGGLWGTGLGQGRHSKFLFLPERHTDFIFAAIGEELGFICGCLVILLFVLLVWRGFKAAVTCPDPFGSLLAAGLVSGVALQAIINIGVVTSSLPITGITLPFISYGGTSLGFTLMSMGILLNISRYSASK